MKKNRDILYSIGGIIGISIWYSMLRSVFDSDIPELNVSLAFITILGLVLLLYAILHSIIKHQTRIMLIFYEKPKGVIEYSVSNKPKSLHLFLILSFFLTFYIIVFMLYIPIQSSLPNIPFVGENLALIFEQFSEYIGKLLSNIFDYEGISLFIDTDFENKLIIFSVLLASGNAIMLVLRHLRSKEESKENEELAKVDSKNNLEKSKPNFPGTRILMIFLYISAVFIGQKFVFDFQSIINIGLGWLDLTLVFILVSTALTVFVYSIIPTNNEQIPKKNNSVLFKVKVRDYIPLTAGHGDEVKRKKELLQKILDSVDDDSGNPIHCLDKKLSLSVCYNLYHHPKESQRYDKDLDNLLKLLLDVLPQHMDNTPDPKPEGLGLMTDNNDKMIFQIHCSKTLVEKESDEGMDIEIKEVITSENS